MTVRLQFIANSSWKGKPDVEHTGPEAVEPAKMANEPLADSTRRPFEGQDDLAAPIGFVAAESPRAVTIAIPRPRERVARHFDLSLPVLVVLALFLCGLVLLPLGWLAWYSITDKNGA